VSIAIIKKILQSTGLQPTPNRLRVMEVIGSNNSPLTATEVFLTIERTQSISRVTVYRILDLLVQHRILERLSSSGRAAYSGLAPNEHHEAHPHFCCTSCGQIDCLTPRSLTIDAGNMQKTFAGEVKRIEVRVEGICRKCLKQRSNH
jgi:Fur family transcriptional regulator, ferric uptake regulator